MILLLIACRNPVDPDKRPADDSAVDSAVDDTGDAPDPCADHGTWSGDANLATQEEIDAFGAAYSRVEGNLYISTQNVEDLSALECVSYVTNNVDIENSWVASLEGLHNLKTVDGNVGLRFNAALLDTDGLRGLESASSVGVYRHSNILSVRFDGLTTVQSFTVANNEAITEVGAASLDAPYEIVLREQPTLTTLDFPSLESAPVIRVVGEGLTSLTGLESLRAVDVELQLQNNSALEQLDALHGLETAGTLTFTGNPVLSEAEIQELVDAIDTITGNVISEGNGG